jgi:aquaporin Z
LVQAARTTNQALFAGGEYITPLWLFWIAPIAGGVIGGLIYNSVLADRRA